MFNLVLGNAANIAASASITAGNAHNTLSNQVSSGNSSAMPLPGYIILAIILGSLIYCMIKSARS